MKFWLGIAGSVWGLIGISALLISAIARLMPLSLDLVNFHLTSLQWAVLAIWLFFMGHFEGYRGFQLQFSPRVAARCLHLKNNPKALHLLLAPFFCMGFFYATKRRIITTWSITLTIVVMVILARHLPQPWRGILDAGVCLGLIWGWLSVIYIAIKTLSRGQTNYSPELPLGQA